MAADAYGVPMTLSSPTLILALAADPDHPVEAAEAPRRRGGGGRQAEGFRGSFLLLRVFSFRALGSRLSESNGSSFDCFRVSGFRSFGF